VPYHTEIGQLMRVKKQLTDDMRKEVHLRATAAQKQNKIEDTQRKLMIEEKKKLARAQEEAQQHDVLIENIVRTISAMARIKQLSVAEILHQYATVVDNGGGVELWNAFYRLSDQGVMPMDVSLYSVEPYITVDVKATDYSGFTYYASKKDDKVRAVFVGPRSNNSQIPPSYWITAINGITDPEEILKSLEKRQPAKIELSRLIHPMAETLEVQDGKVNVEIVVNKLIQISMPCGTRVSCNALHQHGMGYSACRTGFLTACNDHLTSCTNCTTAFFSHMTVRCGVRINKPDLRNYVVHCLTCPQCAVCDAVGCEGVPRSGTADGCRSEAYHGEVHKVQDKCTNAGCKMDHEVFVSRTYSPVKTLTGSVKEVNNDFVVLLGGKESAVLSDVQHENRQKVDVQQYGIKAPKGYYLWVDTSYTSPDNLSIIYGVLYQYFNQKRILHCRCSETVVNYGKHLYETRTEEGHVIDNGDQRLSGWKGLLVHAPEVAIEAVDSNYQEDSKTITFTAADCRLRGVAGHHDARCALCSLGDSTYTVDLARVRPTAAMLYMQTKAVAIGKNKCMSCGGFKVEGKECVFCKPLNYQRS